MFSSSYCNHRKVCERVCGEDLASTLQYAENAKAMQMSETETITEDDGVKNVLKFVLSSSASAYSASSSSSSSAKGGGKTDK